jgi:hypothetical protein
MCNFAFSLQEFFKLVPGLLLLPFSIYLAWKKLGTSISASYTFSIGGVVAPRISSIVLTNHKDKAVAVFAIYAIEKQDIAFEVERFDPPLIIKALESVRVDTRPYSSLTLADTGVHESDYASPNAIDLYVVLAHGTKKCKQANHPGLEPFSSFLGFRVATKVTRQLNGIVYNDDAKYVVMYRMDSTVRTSIIDKRGLLLNDWNFRINRVAEEYMKSKETVRTYLINAGFDKATEWFDVDDIPD